MATSEATARGYRRMSPRGFNISRSPVVKLSRSRSSLSPAGALTDEASVSRSLEHVGDREAAGDAKKRYRVLGSEGQIRQSANPAGEEFSQPKADLGAKITPQEARHRKLILEESEDDSPLPLLPTKGKEENGDGRKKGKRLVKKGLTVDGLVEASACNESMRKVKGSSLARRGKAAGSPAKQRKEKESRKKPAPVGPLA
ncbi:unnamed protein product [Linum trigynum]|uniref:Uncharacterized protein n=1 Tax=Linum trigynum TaxID=586398 RepID=A0AAV2CBX7_9ROSI